MKRFLIILFLFLPVLFYGQELKENTSSFFDESDIKEYTVKNIMVTGEVESPGIIDLSTLPLRNVPLKELSIKNGKDKFIGSYYYSGYSLFDIITSKKVKKTNEAEFRPLVDMYVVVENDKGEKAVFSWGEIYYTKDNFQFLVAKSVNAINPSKLKMKWPLSEESRLVCSRDGYNYRYISNPVKITVKSFAGIFSGDKGSKDIFSPKITISFGSETETFEEAGTSLQKRKYLNIGYGHGMGYKGVKDVEGFLLKDVLLGKFKFTAEDIATSIVCVSAKDGYRAVYSLNEIINRSDNEDFLLSERTDSREDGRYSLFAAPDFFVDRNVRAVEKIEIMKIIK